MKKPQLIYRIWIAFGSYLDEFLDSAQVDSFFLTYMANSLFISNNNASQAMRLSGGSGRSAGFFGRGSKSKGPVRRNSGPTCQTMQPAPGGTT